VSVSQMGKTAAYIRSQPEHHRKVSFQSEFLALLKKHGVKFDEQYLWR
jgi:putative transposase